MQVPEEDDDDDDLEVELTLLHVPRKVEVTAEDFLQQQ